MTGVLTRAALAGVAMTSLGACAHPRRVDLDGMERALAAAPGSPGPTADAVAAEQAVAATGSMAAMVELALARNPELLVEQARVEVLLARVPVAARGPDPELTYEQWGVPLVRPYAVDEADTIMIGIRQALPAPGSLAAQERSAVAAAEAAVYALRARRLDVARQVERACLEHALAEQEILIHREHAGLAQQIVDLTRSNVATGGAAPQDVLRVAVDLQSLHREIARLEQRRRSALALLNAAMGRAPFAPVGATPSEPAIEVTASLTDLQAFAVGRRPELQSAERAVAREHAGVDRARAEATWPSLMLGLDYMYMPHMHERHGYGAMVSINLPWLNPRHRDEVKAAERVVDAETRSATAAAIAVRFEIEDAFARYEAARASYAIARSDLVPAAQQSYEAAQSGYARGRGSAMALLDARRVLLEVRLDELRGRFAVRAAVVDLERAVGGPVTGAPATGGQGDHHE